MPLLILTVIVQLVLIVHVIRTGRPYYWIFLLLLFPGIGGLIYVIAELLPDLSNNYRARRALRGIRSTIDPGADLRRHERQHKLSGSVDAARHLAAELTESGRYAEAIARYEEALTGLYEHDPDLLLGLARAQFGNEQFESAWRTLDRLIEQNPDYSSQEGHLLYARAHEACGNTDKAIEEYDAVTKYFAGAEAKLRYAALLERTGDAQGARELCDELINVAELAPRHYRRAQRQWIGEAKEMIRRLES